MKPEGILTNSMEQGLSTEAGNLLISFCRKNSAPWTCWLVGRLVNIPSGFMKELDS